MITISRSLIIASDNLSEKRIHKQPNRAYVPVIRSDRCLAFISLLELNMLSKNPVKPTGVFL
jgi:hypothetical protein